MNLLNYSPLIVDLLSDISNNLGFQVNRNPYSRYDLLVNSIFFHWSIFQQITYEPQDKKKKHYTQQHEMVQKNVK
jgi:hypothetical protein